MGPFPVILSARGRSSRAAALACALAGLAGCAEEPKVMRLDLAAQPAEVRVWPSPPETPRFRYLGQLTGEGNFRAVEGQSPSGMQKLFRFLVGLGQENREPVVLQRPQTGMVDPEGRIYVTDASRQAVFVFDGVAGKLQVWDAVDSATTLASPVGIALAPSNTVLVADAKLAQVFRFDLSGKPLGRFGKGLLQRPTGLAVDAAGGRIFVADTPAHDIKVFDDTGRLVETLGAPGTGPGELNGPTHLAFADGKLYVADTLNARIEVLRPTGEPLRTIGQPGLYLGNLTRPKGVAADAEGHVYVVESYYDHLLVFDAEGQFLLPIGGSGADIGKFFLPAGVWVDGRDRVFVADMFNGRVVVLQYLGD